MLEKYAMEKYPVNMFNMKIWKICN